MTPSESTLTSPSANGQSKLYHYKPLQIGFVVLCADNNLGHVRSTIANLQRNYPAAPMIVTVSDSMHADDVKALKKQCETYEGKDTITSLINVGMKHAKADWNMLVIAGSYVRPNL